MVRVGEYSGVEVTDSGIHTHFDSGQDDAFISECRCLRVFSVAVRVWQTKAPGWMRIPSWIRAVR